MNGTIELLNSVGAAFVKNSFAMLIQSSLLILLVMGLDFIFRKKIRAIVRYCLWMLVLVKLVLPTTLAMPTGVGYWLGGGFLNPEIAQTQPLQDALPLDNEIVSNGAAPTVSVSNITSDAVAELPAERQPAAVVVNSSHPDITWQAVAFAGWLAVVAAMALLLFQRIMFVGGLLSQSVPAGDDLLTLLGDCKRTLGINSARKVDIKLSTNSASPAICGLFRPVILMPEFLPDKLGKSELRAVLLHELIHLKRGDLWVNTVQTLLQIINFYNPLLWFANAIIRRVREQAVDEAVMVSMGQGSEDYPQALLNVASLSLSRPALSLRLVGVVESKSALAGRIKHILYRPLPKSAKLGITGTIMLLTFAFLLLPMAAASQKQMKDDSKAEVNKVDFDNELKFPTKVVFINNLKYGSTNGETTQLTKTGKMTCGHPGAVSEVSWKWIKNTTAGSEYEFTRNFPADQPDAKKQKKTVEYTGNDVPVVIWRDDVQEISIRHGETKLIGTIRTADDKPLAKKVDISFKSQSPHYAVFSSMKCQSDKFENDVKSGNVWITSLLEGYAPVILGPYEAASMKTIQDIKIVFQHGYEGKIEFVDEDGKPVPSVEITGGIVIGKPSSHAMHNYGKSDADGVFVFKHTLGEPYELEIFVDGYEPENKELRFERGKSVVWKLKKALPTIGTLTGPDGKPIVGATINICTDWLGFSDSSIRKIATTNEQGQFEINSLERDKKYDLLVEASAFGRDVLKNIRAGETDLKLSVGPAVVVRGKITGDIDSIKTDKGTPVISYGTTLKLGETSYVRRSEKSPVRIVNGEGYFELNDLLATSIEITAGDKKIKRDLKKGINDIEIKLLELNKKTLSKDGSATDKSKTIYPQIVATSPAAFANDVSPELGKITVTFDRAMQDRSWSWTGGGDTFPKGDGKISYDDARTTCTMPVKLEAGKVYWVGINSPSYKNFKSVERVPARRYVILFATKGADGKPTTIPQDMLDRAKRIHDAAQTSTAEDAGTNGANVNAPYPQLVKTSPAAFADDVSPELGKITVTFDRAMQDRSWSWTGGGDTFPKGDGKISYDDARTTCTMPVKLEPGKVYWVGINSPSHRNFKSVERVPARRYVILFATKGADGKPTTIPQDMLDRAKRINGRK